MRKVLGALVMAVLLPLGAQGLAAQQQPVKTAHTEHAGKATHRSHAKHRAHVRHARTRETARTERREAQTSMRSARAHEMRSHEERAESRATENRERAESRTARAEPAVLGTPVNIAVPRRMMTNGMSRMSNGLITESEARSIALRNVSGGTSIDKVTFHTEDGRQVYDVKVLTPNQPGNETVRVDAQTGAVVKVKHVDDPAGTVKRAVDRNLNKIRH